MTLIFASKNEKGESAWRLVLEGRKVVTRRLKPLAVGREFAVQPGRGKKSVCRARVVSCVQHDAWLRWNMECLYLPFSLEDEAALEGFLSWRGLLSWLAAKGIAVEDTYRIKFEVIK